MDDQDDRGYAVRVDPSGRWVETEFFTRMKLDRSLAALREAIAMAESEAPRRVLIDVSRVGAEGSRGQMMLLAQRAHESGLRLTDHIAAVVSPSSGELEFVEQTMQDHGYQFFRCFHSRAGAERWLIGV